MVCGKVTSTRRHVAAIKAFCNETVFSDQLLDALHRGYIIDSKPRTGGNTWPYQTATIVYAPALYPTIQQAPASAAMRVGAKAPRELSATADIRNARKATRHNVRFADSSHSL